MFQHGISEKTDELSCCTLAVRLYTQYYDTMREMAKDNPNVIFMPHSPDGQGFTSQMMAAELAAEQLRKKNEN